MLECQRIVVGALHKIVFQVVKQFSLPELVTSKQECTCQSPVLCCGFGSLRLQIYGVGSSVNHYGELSIHQSWVVTNGPPTTILKNLDVVLESFIVLLACAMLVLHEGIESAFHFMEGERRIPLSLKLAGT